MGKLEPSVDMVYDKIKWKEKISNPELKILWDQVYHDNNDDDDKKNSINDSELAWNQIWINATLWHIESSQVPSFLNYNI